MNSRAIYLSYAACASLLCHSLLLSQTDFWQIARGPGGLYSLAVGPSGYLIAGTRAGGVFKSTDNGVTWRQVQANITIQYIAINASGHIFGATTTGIFRSTNEGETWNLVNSGLTTSTINSLTIKPNGNIFAGTEDGIFRSIDNGLTWNKMNSGLISISIKSVAVDSSGNVFAGTWGTIYRSTDDGVNWEQVVLLISGPTIPLVTALVVNSRGFIFANADRIYRSTNSGLSWTQVSTVSFTANTFLADSSGNIFGGSNNALYMSSDDGSTWTSSVVSSPDAYVAVTAINSTGSFFASLQGTLGSGLFRSSDKGSSWVKLNSGLFWVKNVYTLAIDSVGNIFAGAENGMFKSTNYGTTWLETGESLKNTWITSVVVSSNGTIYASTTDSGIFCSTNGGAEWSKVFSLSPNSLAANSLGHVFACRFDFGLYRSTDAGDSWMNMNKGLADSSVRTVAVTAGGVVIAGTETGAFVSSDNGQTWTHTLNGFMQSIGISPLGQVYSSVFAGARNSAIYRSLDNGLSWMNTATLPPVGAFGFNSAGHIFAATQGGFAEGVYMSSDNGTTWSQINSGLGQVYITSVAVNSNDFVFVAVYDGHVYKSMQRTTSVEEVDNTVPREFVLEQNYPNPFNPTTRIQFSVSQKEFISLEIFDALGRNLRTLVSESLSPGTYQVEWNGSAFSSGIYFCRLQSSGFVATRKLLLLK